MDGSVLQNKIAAFRVYPYHARRKIKLPDNLTGLTGLSEGELEEIINGPEPDDTPPVELRTEGTIEELPAEVPEDEGWSSTSEEYLPKKASDSSEAQFDRTDSNRGV
ncbi:hypothetical protein K435DRAFT_881224 [Dendrothele bispora CBS 962.96]|uniref:Uncharacterized protein n=1 Tax=Dendrothele bispora (strain CBS 962.96) TaxID=1314807 RepID=A0A4V4HAF4_DENBC|nr:hypothetical protein K435DRAFT_881224 [Dendrothele bispora CBS 962.96]